MIFSKWLNIYLNISMHLLKAEKDECIISVHSAVSYKSLMIVKYLQSISRRITLPGLDFVKRRIKCNTQVQFQFGCGTKEKIQ